MNRQQLSQMIGAATDECRRQAETRGSFRSAATRIVTALDPVIIKALAEDRLAELAQMRERQVTRRAERASQRPNANDPERKVWLRDTDEGRAWAAESARINAENRRALNDTLSVMIDAHLQRCRTEWTRDTLDRRYQVVRGGTFVTLGDMTLEQHRQRYDMLANDVISEIETAAIHAQAIDDLTDANCNTLNQMAGTASAA